MRRFAFPLRVALALLVAQSLSAQEVATGSVVLSLAGNWRAFYALNGPFVRDEETLTQVGEEVDSPAAPPDWRASDFDDSAWHRLRGLPCQPNPYGRDTAKANPGFCYLDGSSAFQSLICLRGRFRVTDLSQWLGAGPAAAKDMTLMVEYRGGVVVYLNGVEIARGHMPAGEVTPGTLAEDYPFETFVGPDGKVMQYELRKAPPAEFLTRIKRRLASVKVPARLLRNGVNVLAIEVHRSAYPKAYVDAIEAAKVPHTNFYLRSSCGITDITLKSPDGKGVVPNVVRPEGMQVWNSSLYAEDPFDFGDPLEALRPVVIPACRNGAFSGEVTLGSRETIVNPRAVMSDLVNAKTRTVIASSAAEIRYGDVPIALDEVKVVGRSAWRSWDYADAPPEVPGAVLPITLTVNVPRDAAPGDYEGTLTIAAEGGGPFTVPVRVSVAPSVLPDPRDYETYVDIIQSPDTLALQYEVPMWSEAHWKLIDRSFEVLSRAGLDTIYIPMMAETHFGNSQSMVRWVKKPDGTYSYDFTVLERYLDAYGKHNGKPRIVCLYVWDLSLEGGSDWINATGGFMTKEDVEARKEHAKLGLGPVVTVLDPATGKTERLELPQYSDAGSLALWKPVYDELRARLAKRGILDKVMLGIPLDPKPTKGVVDLFNQLMPGTPWMVQDHIYVKGEKIHGAPVAYQANVFLHGVWMHDVTKSRYRMKHDEVRLLFPRSLSLGLVPIEHRLLSEKLMLSGLEGFARVGGDMWPVIKGKRGRGRPLMVTYRYTKANAGGLGVWVHLLQPGPEGAVAPTAFEMLREGVQETEARAFVEGALLDRKITGDLAERCQDALMRRNRATLLAMQGKINDPHQKKWYEDTMTYGFGGYARSGYLWHLSSGHEARTKELFDLAGEVRAALGDK